MAPKTVTPIDPIKTKIKSNPTTGSQEDPVDDSDTKATKFVRNPTKRPDPSKFGNPPIPADPTKSEEGPDGDTRKEDDETHPNSNTDNKSVRPDQGKKKKGGAVPEEDDDPEDTSTDNHNASTNLNTGSKVQKGSKGEHHDPDIEETDLGNEPERIPKSKPKEPSDVELSRVDALNKTLRKPKFPIEELETQLEIVDLNLDDIRKLRRNGFMQLDPEKQAAVQAAAEEITRSKWPDYTLKGLKVLTVIAGVALCVVSHGGALGLIAVPIVIAKVAHGVSAAKTVIDLFIKARKALLDQSKDLREEGMEEMLRWTGVAKPPKKDVVDYKVDLKAFQADVEEIKIFKTVAAQMLKELHITSIIAH